MLLNWPQRAVQAGVPVDLTIQALTEAGEADGARGGSVSLLVDDLNARVTMLGANQPTLSGEPVSTGQRVAIPLAGGKA